MPDAEHFRLIEFNLRRLARGAEAARMEIGPDGDWLWMSPRDIEGNIKRFGPHPELLKARALYASPTRFDRAAGDPNAHP